MILAGHGTDVFADFNYKLTQTRKLMAIVTQCIRCGKPRILSKTWSEYIGTSQVTYTESVCPDVSCQKRVDQVLKDRQDVLVNRIQTSLKRRKENIAKTILLRKTQAHEKELKKIERKQALKHE